MYYNLKRSDVSCVFVDLSKVCCGINTSLLYDKVRKTDLLGQVMARIDFMGKNRTLLSAHLREGNWMMNGMSRMECDREVFIFYLNEVITVISMLPDGFLFKFQQNQYIMICRWFTSSCTQALQLLLNTFTSKLYTLSLQVNVQKSSNIVFRHSNKKVSPILTMKNQPLR